MKKGMKVLGATLAASAMLAMLAGVATAATTVAIQPDGVNAGEDAYQLFKDKLGSDPVDGPDTDHIYEVSDSTVGTAFEFLLHSTGDYDGSNTDRQRNEVKAYNSSPADVKASEGDTMTYDWKFRVDPSFQTPGGFCHIFQLKAQGGDDGAPILTFSVLGSDTLAFRHSPIGATMDEVETLASVPMSQIRGTWVEATVTASMTDNGALSMTLKRLSDGQTLMSYSGQRDMWRDGADINRPKWGIYRAIYSGMTEAKVRFTDFRITKGDPDGGSGNGNWSGYYKIVNRNSGEVADVEGASTADKANIQQFPWYGTGNQEWQIADAGDGHFKILNRNSGKAMTVENASTEDKANVFQYTFGGSATNDEWDIVDLGGGYYEIVNVNSGKALDVAGASTDNKANIQQFHWNGGTNQQWQIVSVN